MYLPHLNAITPEMSPSDSMPNLHKQTGASFVCLYYNGRMKERVVNMARLSQGTNPVDNGLN